MKAKPALRAVGLESPLPRRRFFPSRPEQRLKAYRTGPKISEFGRRLLPGKSEAAFLPSGKYESMDVYCVYSGNVFQGFSGEFRRLGVVDALRLTLRVHYKRTSEIDGLG
jgi:hypothetical protein